MNLNIKVKIYLKTMTKYLLCPRKYQLIDSLQNKPTT